jgi:hypothetical protein
LDWESFPRDYVLRDIAQRVRDELLGGDPRNGVEMDVAAFDPSSTGEEHSAIDV